MSEAVDRFDQMVSWDLTRVVAALGEAVWWVTLVDATLVRYHPGIYDTVLDRRPAANRQMIGDTLAGLRYVRNEMGRHRDLAEFVRGGQGADWTWRSLPAPDCDTMSAHGQEWELTRYEAYQLRLAGRQVAEGFALAAGFLIQTAADAAELTGPAATGPVSGSPRR
jgi:hypothetical protein